eukprot:9582310-Prorocentrum_lima.AAC.1
MTSSLVGSEMCIRDSITPNRRCVCDGVAQPFLPRGTTPDPRRKLEACPCLLYTSDAADDM